MLVELLKLCFDFRSSDHGLGMAPLPLGSYIVIQQEKCLGVIFMM